MKSFLKDVMDLLDFIDNGVKRICILLAGLMTLTVVLQVLFRYILKNPLVWTEELSRYLMIWMSFIGASSTLKNWENIRVEYFIEKVPYKIRRIIELTLKITIFIFIIYVFKSSIKIYPKVSANQVTPAMGIKMIWPQFGIIIGMCLMVIQMTGVLIKEIFGEGEYK